MHKRNMLFLIPMGVLLLFSGATAQEVISWQPTLESAKQIASKTNRLVLIHFWAEWCGPCKRMEREVLNQPAVAAVINRYYVPVKINRDHFPATCTRYGITALPSDIIITPQGDLMGHFKGLVGAQDYMARLNHIAATGRRPTVPQQPQVPIAQTRTSPHYPNQPYGSVNSPRPNGPDYSQGRHPGNVQQNYVATVPPMVPPATPRQQYAPAQPQPPISRSVEAPRAQAPPAQTAMQQGPIQRPTDNPPLGLGGYCPVQLNDDMQGKKLRWTPGDPRWGVIHRGRTYLFSGLEQQRRFLADPDRYSPVLSGNDVVVAIDQQRMMPGLRKHGILFHNKVYLFASEATLNTFAKNSNHYANLAMQAMLANAARQRTLR